jgi:hypothetical protein
LQYPAFWYDWLKAFSSYFSSLFLVDCSSRLNARVDPGSLNAGKAWILGGREVDGFGGMCEQMRADSLQVLY